MTNLPTSKFQEQFWLLNMLAPNSAAYNIPTVISLDKLPNYKALENSVRTLINRHAALRTGFAFVDMELSQVVYPPEECHLSIHVQSINENADGNNLPAEIMEEVHAPFNLENKPLLRVKLFEYQNNIFLTIVFHHIIVDLHSKHIFINELSELYNGYITKKDNQPMPPTAGYPEYSQWHNRWLKSDEAKKQLSKLQKYLPDAGTILNLPADKPRPKALNQQGKRIFFKYTLNLSLAVNNYAEANTTNPFVILLSAYAVFLHKLTQQSNIVIGVPLSNRRNETFKNTFGCFVNVIPLNVEFTDGYTNDSIRQQVRQKLLQAHRVQELPFLTLIQHAREKRDTSFNPYYQTGFTFEPPVNISFEGIQSQSLPIERNGAQLDLFLTMWENNNIFQGYFEYASDVFEEKTVRSFIESFKDNILEMVNAQQLTSKKKDIPNADKQKLIKWNNTEQAFNKNICLHQVFEKTVLEHPDNIAIQYTEGSLSYANFNKHINKLAHYLINDHKIKVEEYVAIALDRSPEMVLAIFAIIKSGAAYLPLDPNSPANRITDIVADARPRCIITTQKNRSNLPAHVPQIIIDDILLHPLSGNSQNPDVKVQPNNLAYTMYTSGSTGKSKGVMIEHASVVNKITWMQNTYPLSNTDCLMLKTPVTFDVSVWELFWWSFNGACLSILPSGTEKEPYTIVNTIEKHMVTAIIFVPSMFSPFTAYVKQNKLSTKLTTLKYLVQIGETLTPQHVEAFNELRNHTFSPQLINTYGPTEATIAVSYFNCPTTNPVDKIYIGKPIANTKLLIVDPDNNILPIGTQGELVISGTNLARGYLNREELNREKFIELDYFGTPLRVYKTGDLARWSSNGQLDFIGRTDNQVKIRGYRIELGDIEAKILEVNGVKNTAVITYPQGNNNKQIIAYFASYPQINTSVFQIKEHLQNVLPPYMIPAQIIKLDDIPLNTSGKTDKKALPPPVAPPTEHIYLPSSETEKKLGKIWCQLLNINKVSTHHNFFDIGGDSLSAIKLVNAISSEFNIKIEPIDLMQYPNIKELAKYISNYGKQKTEITDSQTPPVHRRRIYKNVRNNTE